MIIPPQQWKISAIENGTAYIWSGVKQLNLRVGSDEIDETEQKRLDKQLARERKKIDGYNPEMGEIADGVFGDDAFYLVKVPLNRALPRSVKKELKSVYGLKRKGFYAELQAKYGTTRMDWISQKILDNASSKVWEARMTARGTIVIKTVGDWESGFKAAPSARPELAAR